MTIFLQFITLFKKYKSPVQDLLHEPEVVKLGRMNQAEANKHMKDRHCSINGSSCACIHQIGMEAINFLESFGTSSIYQLFYLNYVTYPWVISGIIDPNEQNIYFERLLLKKTEHLKPNLLTIHDIEKSSQLRKVNVRAIFNHSI